MNPMTIKSETVTTTTEPTFNQQREFVISITQLQFLRICFLIITNISISLKSIENFIPLSSFKLLSFRVGDDVDKRDCEMFSTTVVTINCKEKFSFHILFFEMKRMSLSMKFHQIVLDGSGVNDVFGTKGTN
jgi:hypothetical protein